jgi:hypothetical protein
VNRITSLIILTLLLNQSFAQDTLPNFSLVERGNKVIVSWVNPYESVIQLNVQRSFDSSLNFRTIFSATSPQLPQNGYTDTKMPTNRTFYRIFYVLKGGSYFFTRSIRAGSDYKRDIQSTSVIATGGSTGIITIKVKESVFTKIPATKYRIFRDSVLQNTKDTLNAVNDSMVVILPYSGPDNYRPSIYIFSSRDGINISLPGVNSKKYHVKFFEENGNPIFEIQHIREPQLILDKSNFLHAGWFFFELYEDEKLKEKSKFFLSKDF